MKNEHTGFKVKSDGHPISIVYRGKKRMLRALEKLMPKLMLNRRMQYRSDAAVQSEDSIQERLNRFSSHCHFSNVDFTAKIVSEDRQLLKQLSENILQHRFNLLGSGPVFLGERIQWHRDFVTGFKWDPSQRYSEVGKTTPQGSDIKRPWELSRFQHLIPLGLAWKLDRNKAYQLEFVSEIEDWMKLNPVGTGVNWACPMDVAIRSVNWLAGYTLFHPALLDHDSATFLEKLTRSLWEHARFIETHLEWNGPFSERRANHFLANLTGLFTLGVFFSDTKLGRRWLKFSYKWLEKEVRRQVLDDGVYFECSMSYHRLCLEMFHWCHSIGELNNIPFSRGYKQRLNSMRIFSKAYSRPDGIAPQIGDNDDGRLLSTGLVSMNDHRYLYSGLSNNSFCPDAAIHTGNYEPPKNKDMDRGILTFTDGGFYVVKLADMHMLVRGGRIAHIGTHAHCDQLSFDLSLKNSPVFVDRGTYVYRSDREKRSLYRGTKAHNVLSVNGAEQCRAMGNILRLINDTQTQVLKASDNEIKARHSGFMSINRNGVVHTRTFRIYDAEPMIEIIDEVGGLKEGDLVEWFFHLSPGLDVECSDQRVKVFDDKKTVCEMNIPTQLHFKKIQFEHSPSYGRLQEAQTMVLSKKISKDCSICEARYQILWEE